MLLFFASLGKYGLWKDFLEAGFRAVVRPELLLVSNVVWNRVIGLSCGAFCLVSAKIRIYAYQHGVKTSNFGRLNRLTCKFGPSGSGTERLNT